MKPRARRITILTVGAGGLVMVGLVVLNWYPVKDHVEAWWFVATTETETAIPLAPGARRPFSILANLSGRPVIYDPSARFDEPPLGSGWLDPLLRELQGKDFRVIDQRFPRRAYVVTGYPAPDFESPRRPRGGTSMTLELKGSR